MVQFYRPTPEKLESARRFKDRLAQAGYRLMSLEELAEWKVAKRKSSEEQKPREKDPNGS
jgi:hypothetical protein